DGHTPLHHGYKPLELAKILIYHGADVTRTVEKPINNGWTALHLAACWGLEDIARLLLTKGANINAKTDQGATALHTASGLGKTAMVQLLLRNGAEAEIQSNSGETALQKAVMNGSEEVVKVILK
ncbi:ankyrin repeat domain-containing protein, partial [Aspergillus ruber CBS 135680]